MGKTIVTNNSKVYNKYKDLYELVYLEDGNYTDPKFSPK